MSIRYPGGLITKTPVTPSGPTGTNTAPGVWTIEQALEYQKAGNWPSSAGTIDTNFEYVTLLLPGNGTNGAQNNTFLDSSANNFTITRNGNTTQGTFSPYGDNWSNYFDGNGDYLQLSYNSAFSFGSGDFTIEGWWYLNNLSSAAHPITFAAASPTSANDIGFYIYIDGSANEATVCNGGSYYSVTGWSVQLNSWQHFAFVRQSGTLRLYINGVQVGSASANVSINDNAAWTLKLGAYRATSPTRFLNGYLSNVRLLKGTCQYLNGTTFTPPTAPLTAITNTSLLTCQSNRFIDNSTNAFAITRNGDVSVQRFSPFSPTASYAAATIGGSGYFDGSGDYLTAPDNAALQMGSGDFTIEYWWYPNNITSYQNPVEKGYTGAGALLLQTGNGDGRIIVYASGSAVITSSTAVAVNAWNHMALVRSGTTLTLYQNGASVGSATNSTNFNNTATLGIGATATAPGGGAVGAFPIVGYLSNVRFVKGTAVYSGSTYTIPSSPLTGITNTSLLLNMTNAGIIDNAMMNDLETVGNAQISTTQSKFGGGSMYFDGTGDWVKRDISPLFFFGTENFTVEAWVFFSALPSGSPAYSTLLAQGDADTATDTRFFLTSTGLSIFTSNTSRASASFSWSTNTWYHVAFVRNAGNLLLFVNGTLLSTTAYATAFPNPTTYGPYIGADSYRNQGLYTLNGYIDDLRITKGVARYTANFTPPTAAFPTR